MISKGGDTTLDSLLEFVRDSRGFDFTGYKRSSVQRRVAKRMADLGIECYDDYLDQLQLNSDEFVELFNTILINVTGFFRDPRSWEFYATAIVPSCSPPVRRMPRSGCGRRDVPPARRPIRWRWSSRV